MKQWKDTQYYVTEDGNIWSDFHKKFLNKRKEKNGYLTVCLYKRGKGNYRYLVHRMVAECYIPNPNNLPEVNHKDLNKENCAAYNLEWCTHSENIKHLSSNSDYNPINNIPKGSGTLAASKVMSKKVGQYKDGVLIATFDSTRIAANNIGCDKSGIAHACRGIYKQYKGYEWRYL